MHYRTFFFLLMSLTSLGYCDTNRNRVAGQKAAITVSVSSNVYTYSIKNIGSGQINTVQFKPYASYNFEMPEGWTSHEDKPFFSESGKDTSIGKEDAKIFSLRASSKGSVLGQGSVIIGFSDGSQEIIEGVWQPAKESPLASIAVVTTVVLILVLHTFWILRKRKKTTT